MKKLIHALAATGLITLAPATLAQPARNNAPGRPQNEDNRFQPPNANRPGNPPQGMNAHGNHPQHPAAQNDRPAPKPAAPQHNPKPAPAPAAKPAPVPTKPAVKPAPAPVPTKPAVKPAPMPAKPEPPRPAPMVKPEPPRPAPAAKSLPLKYHTHKPGLPPGYRPGFKGYTLPRPFEHHYYADWVRPVHKQFFELDELPDAMQIELRPGQHFEIQLEEERRDGYEWFARYDNYYINLDVDHEKGHRMGLFGHRIRYAEIDIIASRPGASIVELIYANRAAWDNGDAPEKVIPVYILTK